MGMGTIMAMLTRMTMGIPTTMRTITTGTITTAPRAICISARGLQAPRWPVCRRSG